jgi:RND family efflux transporter MFP subunit
VSRRVRAVALGLSALVVALLVVSLRGPRVELCRVARRDLAPVVSGLGEILPPARVEVRPAVMGKILRVGVAQGQSVSAGDLLAELDAAPYADQALQAEKAVEESARAAGIAARDAETAGRKVDRAATLSRKRIASGDYLAAARIDLEKARQAQARATEALSGARARLAVAREAIGRSRVTAPIAGRVVGLRARVAETVAEGTPIAVIEQSGVLRALVRIRAEDERFVKAGERAAVTVPGTRLAWSGEVAPDGPPNKTADSAYVSVMLAIPAASPIPAGTAVRARIEAAPLRAVLVVPVAALRERGARRSAEVFVAEEGRARRRDVGVGARGDRDAEILSGVTAGEPVVCGPARVLSRLEHGARIVPVERKEE